MRLLGLLVVIACFALPENVHADPISILSRRSGFAMLGSGGTGEDSPTSINQINEYTDFGTVRGNITADITMTTTGNLIEVLVDSINLNNDSPTLSGSSYDYFVVEIIGNMKLTESASLQPSGGMIPSSIIYSFSGKSWTIDTQLGNSLNGILPASNSTIDLSAIFHGQLVLGRGITPQPSPPANGPSTPVPEPSTFILLCCGLLLLAVGAFIRRRTFQ